MTQSPVISRHSSVKTRAYVLRLRTGDCRPTTDDRRLTTSAFLFILAFLCAPGASAAGLTEAHRLSSIYDSILSARFSDADAQLKAACPPAPEGACRALDAVNAWWRILLDPESRALDQPFVDRANAAVAANEAWTKSDPRSAEAWFYLAGSYAPLAQWRVLRGERLAAARDGKRIKDALERSLALDPTIKDAYFGIGLYHYYADVAPAAAKFLRFLLLLPGGDKAQGLKEMLEAREGGQLLRGEADYQLHVIYLWYEHNTTRALALLDGLDDRYGSNPLFLQRIAEVQNEYKHDHPAAAASWQLILDRARAGKINEAATATVRAELGLAAELDALAETDRSIELVQRVIAAAPASPFQAVAKARAQLAAYEARLGIGGPVRNPAATKATDAYRLGLQAWRAFERRAWDEAEAGFSAAEKLAPADPVIAYRHGRLLEARGDHAAARASFERVIESKPVAPAFVLGSAYVECARLVEATGDRARAIDLYRAATTIVGADAHARDRARDELKRLTSTTRTK